MERLTVSEWLAAWQIDWMDMWLTHMLNDRLIVWVSDQQINWLSKPFTVLNFFTSSKR
jgi:hypothetical protein